MSAETPEKKPDSAQDKQEQATAQLNNLNQLTKALQSFLEQLALLIVTKNWVSLLLLLDAALIIFCFPGGILPKFLESTFALELPQGYSAYFGITVAAIFLTALVIAIRTIAKKPPTLPDFTERKAIKGLQAFSKEDAVIFAQLQRDRDLRECLEAITSPTFRFGILMGESGVGKTSFLQAGIIPQLNQTESKFKGIYIRFSNQDPIITIYQALTAELATPAIAINEQDLLKILSWAVDTSKKPLILIFDQFEQFFVHYKQKIDRKPFVDALKSWYCTADPLAVKILISIRGDLADKLTELQKALGYSLSPYEVFRLERFSPTEATRILQVIAQAEAIKFDEKFVRELTAEELASNEDGLISPVDLQVLARTIERQKNQELQAFNRSAFQKIGGIEGLMTRFLNTTLDARLPSQRQGAIKVLLAMTDLERNVRAGVLTLQDLQQKIQGTLTPGEIVEATTWLASGGVRLITLVDPDGTNGYELAHERLIPAIREVAKEELTEIDRANQLLDQRVNIWLDDPQSSRYLLNWQELRLIERQKLQQKLRWGTNKSSKERFLRRSWRKLYQQLVPIGLVLVIALVSMGWWHSPVGQIQQVRWELERLSKRVDYFYREKAALAFFKDEDLEKTLKIIDSIDDSDNKASNLIDIVRTIGKLENFPQADQYLAKVITAAESIDNPYYNARIVTAIAETYGKLGDLSQANQYLAKVITAAESIDNPYYNARIVTAIAETYGKLENLPQANQYLTQAITITEQIKSSDDKALNLTAIAETYGKLGNLPQANQYLTQAITITEQIKSSDDKALNLTAIAETYNKLGNLPQANQYLAQAITITEEIDNLSEKARVLAAIVQTIGKLENFSQANQYLTKIINSNKKIDNSQIFGSSYTASILMVIAETIAKQGSFPEADKYIVQAITAAEKIPHSSNKANILIAVTHTQAKLARWRQAHNTVSLCPTDECKVESLAHILTAWAEKKNPAVK